MSLSIKKIIFYISILAIFADNCTHAASVFLIQEQKGDFISISVMLDTEGENINAMAGTLTFDTDLLSNPTIYDKKSIVKNWIESPYLDATTSKSISWAGIVPGGFSGVRSGLYKGTRPGELFRFIFSKIKSGTTTIILKDLDLRLNDGLATSVPVSDQSFNISFTQNNTDTNKVLTIKSNTDGENYENNFKNLNDDKNIFITIK